MVIFGRNVFFLHHLISLNCSVLFFYFSYFRIWLIDLQKYLALICMSINMTLFPLAIFYFLIFWVFLLFLPVVVGFLRFILCYFVLQKFWLLLWIWQYFITWFIYFLCRYSGCFLFFVTVLYASLRLLFLSSYYFLSCNAICFYSLPV